MTFANEDLYPTEIEKIGRLAFGLAKNHPFIDGNKRIGAAVISELLRINHIYFDATDQELTQAISRLANNKDDYKDLIKFLLSHSYFTE